MTTQGLTTSSTADRLDPRRRRVFYATIAAIVAVAALVLILRGPADNESAGSSGNPAPTEEGVVTPAPQAATQNFSAALPSCCYPPPTTVPADPALPPA